VEVDAVTNSDDPKFDDSQNPDEELDISMFFEADENEKVEDVVESDSIDLDFPDESLHGENTQPFADELDMFTDLGVATTNAVEEVAEESGFSTEIDDLFADLESAAEPVEQMEMIDNPILAAAIEDIPVVEDKKTKKAREKAEKAQAIAQAKAAKAQAKADKAAGKTQARTAGEDAPVVEDKKAKKAREKAEKAQALAQAKAEKAQAKADGKKPVKTEKPPKAKKEKKPKEPGDKQPKNVSALAFMTGLVLMLLAFGGVNAYVVMKHGIGGAMYFLAIFDVLAFIAIVIPIVLRRSKDTVTTSDVGLGIAAISLIVGCMFVLANVAL